MKTLVEVRKGRDFSVRNLGTLDIEQPINVPGAGLLGVFRTRVNLARSQSKAGEWADLLIETTEVPAYDAISLLPSDTTRLAIAIENTIGENEAASILFVCEFIIGQRSQPAGWEDSFSPALYFRGSSDGSTCSLLSRSSSAPSKAATLPISHSRWEFVAGVRDPANGQIRAYLPRTGAEVSTEETVFDPIDGIFRIGSGAEASGWCRTAFAAAYRRALSSSEINDIYASVKSSLAVSDIEI
ncbi:MAG: hypothetical protein ACRBBM_12515 [Pseudomonadaceae bacterium]